MKIMMKALMMRMITSLDRVANVQTSWIFAGAIKSKFIFYLFFVKLNDQTINHGTMRIQKNRVKTCLESMFIRCVSRDSHPSF